MAYRRTREKISALTGRLAEDIGAMRVIQAFSEEERTSREFDGINRDNRDANVTGHRARLRLYAHAGGAQHGGHGHHPVVRRPGCRSEGA